MRWKLLSFPSEALRHLGLLIAFALIIAAGEFTSAHPGWASLLVFLFSLPYLAASIVTKRASFLYPTMLLGAVAYFMACYALGAPASSFPLLSVPLVVGLLAISRRLAERLPATLADYPATVLRAMNITVAVFAAWAAFCLPALFRQGGFLAYVPGLTYICFACLYLVHCFGGGWFLYMYVFAGFAVLGGTLSIAVAAHTFSWLGAVASAAAVLYVGTALHKERTYSWSRHLYFASAPLVFIALGLSLLRIEFLPLALACASILLWGTYVRYSSVAVDIRRAAMAETVVAKAFFFASIGFALPVVAMVFVWSTNAFVAGAALVCGLTFCWMAWVRRGELVSLGSVYAPSASFFITAGLIGIGTHLPALGGRWWAVAVPALLILATLRLEKLFDDTDNRVVRGSLAEAGVFAALAGWYIPVMHGESTIAMASAALSLVAVAATGITNARRFVAAGTCLAGIVIARAVLAGDMVTAWMLCAGAATVAGAAYRAGELLTGRTMRLSAYFAWLILSAAALVTAVAAGSPEPFYAATAVAAVAALLTMRTARRVGDPLSSLTQVAASAATLLALALGPLTGASLLAGGVCLLALSAAYWLAWVVGRGAWQAYWASALFSLGCLLVILAKAPSAHMRLAAGAILLLVLLSLAAASRKRSPAVFKSSLWSAHMASLVLVGVCLVQSWAAVAWLTAAAALLYVLVYAVASVVLSNAGSRVGSVLWLSLTVLLAMAAYAGAPYWQQTTALVFLALVWLALAYSSAPKSMREWSMPLYVCAALVAGFCAGVSLFAPAAEHSWIIFLVNGAVYTALFLVFKHDVFSYLLTLSLSLTAYDWVKTSSNHFTQDVLFYLIIASAVLGALFALPHLKKFLSRVRVLPTFSIYTMRGAALLAAPIALFSFMVASAYSLKVTAHPRFCTSCHNMGTYYDSWQHSSHAEVACIECHYEPGVENELKGKVGGIVQVVKFMSHSYDTKPHAMISNESCMREGCHTGMDHSKDILLFRDKVRFRHDKHVTEHPRGRVLNCVSCHGQTVKGQHISVTETTCITCHFYGRGKEPVAAGECLTCHDAPAKPVSFMGQTFNHVEFLEGKEAVECANCHSQVTEGTGAVSSTRCRACHLEETAPIEDLDRFHLVHVSEGHFECLECHDEIKHGFHPMEQQLLSGGNCQACHEGERHSLQERIYAGTAIESLQGEPDVMYRAGVACDGCHTAARVAGLGAMPFTKRFSGAKQCVDCHGGSFYGQMLEAWQDDTKERLEELQGTAARLEEDLASLAFAAEQGVEAKALLASAKEKLLTVVEDGSLGAHNYAYISEILDGAKAELSKCRSLTRQKEPVETQEPVR